MNTSILRKVRKTKQSGEIDPHFEKIFVATLLTSATFLAFGVMATTNEFLEEVLGEGVQARIEAPLLEELLKPLGLILLGIIHARRERISFLKKTEVVYMLGFLLGGLTGIMENFFSYGFFSGFRSATPLVHALSTGIFAIGLHRIINEGRKGTKILISAYLTAVIIHSVWNNLGLDGPASCMAVMAIAITILGLGSFWYAFYRYQKTGEKKSE